MSCAVASVIGDSRLKVRCRNSRNVIRTINNRSHINIRTHTRTHQHIHPHNHLCTYPHTITHSFPHIRIHIRTHTPAYTHRHNHPYTHPHTRTYTQLHTHSHTSAYISAHMRTFTHIIRCQLTHSFPHDINVLYFIHYVYVRCKVHFLDKFNINNTTLGGI